MGSTVVSLDQRALVTGNLSRIGVKCFFVACFALGSVELIFGKPLPELHPFPLSSPVLVYAAGATLAILAVAAIARVSGARRGLSLYWTAAVPFTLFAALKIPPDPLDWVPVSKVVLFALAAAVSGGWCEGRRLRLSLGVTLLFYGLIHLIFHDLISGLIPAWIHQPTVWPYITGTLMIVAGAALVAGRAETEMAVMTAGLFASWILIIHAGRIAAHPNSSFEWTFALSALALTGIALMALNADPAGQMPVRQSSEPAVLASGEAPVA